MDREETAYHEAGHYVAACLIGTMPGALSIVPDAVSLGRVGRLNDYSLELIGFEDIERLPEEAIEHLAKGAHTNAFLCVSGGVAAQRFLDLRAPDTLATGTWGDFCDAMATLEKIDLGDAAWTLETIEETTRRIFSQEAVWQATDYVARQLLRHDTIEYGTDLFIDLNRMAHQLLGDWVSPPHYVNVTSRLERALLQNG